MSVVERLSDFIAGIRARIARRGGDRDASAVDQSPIDQSSVDQSSLEPPLDPAEEFVKIQRGLRRLSLASDRSGEILQAVATRLDEVQQSILNQSRSQQPALALDEPQLLHILDQLDRFTGIPDLPAVAPPLVHEIKTVLLARARWRPVALIGAEPGGADIQIAEFIGEPGAKSQADVRIRQILQQGYRRADGTLLRPGVVIAGASPPIHHSIT